MKMWIASGPGTVINEEGEPIADVYGRGYEDQVTNTLIVAAALELLEFLEFLISGAESNRNDISETELRNITKALINKARGLK